MKTAHYWFAEWEDSFKNGAAVTTHTHIEMAIAISMMTDLYFVLTSALIPRSDISDKSVDECAVVCDYGTVIFIFLRSSFF